MTESGRSYFGIEHLADIAQARHEPVEGEERDMSINALDNRVEALRRLGLDKAVEVVELTIDPTDPESVASAHATLDDIASTL